MMQSILFIFFATVMADFGWARYTSAIQSGRKVMAGLWSACVYALGLVVVSDVVDRPVLILAACAGAFVGTVLGAQPETEEEVP